MNLNQHISDESLMQALQRGEEPAFNELYARYSRRILFFMFKMLKQDEAKAQDLMQDVFLKIVEQPEKFDANRSFKTWIFTVAANLCKNYFRSQKGGLLTLDEAPVLMEDAYQIVEPFQQELLQQNLAKALDELPYYYREAFLLKHKEGLSLKEIAQVMDCPLGTVKSRLNSATKKLASQLKPYQTNLYKN